LFYVHLNCIPLFNPTILYFIYSVFNSTLSFYFCLFYDMFRSHWATIYNYNFVVNVIDRHFFLFTGSVPCGQEKSTKTKKKSSFLFIVQFNCIPLVFKHVIYIINSPKINSFIRIIVFYTSYIQSLIQLWVFISVYSTTCFGHIGPPCRRTNRNKNCKLKTEYMNCTFKQFKFCSLVSVFITMFHIKIINFFHNHFPSFFSFHFCYWEIENYYGILQYPYLLTELSPSWDAANCAATQETPSNFKEPETSSPCSQEPSTGPYPEPDRSSPYIPFYISKIYFNIVYSPTSWSS
jgi:hypothetical protein